MRILIVDDAESDRALASSILAEVEHWQVETASSLSSASRLLASNLPDCLVVDIRLAGQDDGLEFASQVAMQHPGLPVVAMTGLGSAELVAQALENGVTDYVPKSRMQQDLVGAVQRALNAKQLQASAEQLMRYATELRYEFELDVEPSLVSSLVAWLSELLERSQLGADAIREEALETLQSVLEQEFPPLTSTGPQPGSQSGHDSSSAGCQVLALVYPDRLELTLQLPAAGPGRQPLEPPQVERSVGQTAYRLTRSTARVQFLVQHTPTGLDASSFDSGYS